MGRSTTGLALKAVGIVLFAVVAFYALQWLLNALLSVVVTLAVLAVFGLVLYGLARLAFGSEEPERPDPANDWALDGIETDRTDEADTESGGWRQYVPGLGGSSDAAETDDEHGRLRERYVEGEISEEELEREMQILLATDEDSGDGEFSVGTNGTERERL